MVYISGVYLAVKALKLLQDNFVLPTAPNSSTASRPRTTSSQGTLTRIREWCKSRMYPPRRIGDAKHQPHASITETGATTEPEQ